MAKRMRILASILIPALAAGGASPPSFAAATQVRDGEPTAEACSALGYDLRQSRYDGPPRRMAPYPSAPQITPRIQVAPPAGIAAPPAIELPAPPGPPPPPPSQEVMVTGSRSARDSFAGRYAPPPRSASTERYPQAASNTVKRVAEAPVSTFSIDVDTASYANVRRFLNDGQTPPRDAVRVEELVNYFDYGYRQPQSRAQPFQTFVAVAPSPWARGKQVIQVGLQGYTLPKTNRPPVNLTFLVDVSGSMNPADRLPLAKKSLNLLIDQLRPQDRVAMAVYAGAAGTVLEPTPGTDKLRMRCAVEALNAGGSTAGGAGLALAYRLAKQNYRAGQVNRVILMTDGDFNVGVTNNRSLEDFVADQRKTGIYLSVYGFGRGNYQDLRMQTISQAGNGTAGYVDSVTEARRLFAQEFTRELFPIADDVKIQVEFNPARVSDYRLIGYETRLLNREDFNNDKVDAGDIGSGTTVTALYEITPVGSKAAMADPLRYKKQVKGDPNGEYAFLKIRYKLPGEKVSKLITRPITSADASDFASVPQDMRFAASVAGAAQLMRNDPYIKNFSFDRAIDIANAAKGDDKFGYRREFIQMLRLAKSLPAQKPLDPPPGSGE